ncbi:MAG: Com family DNA-binding transcriptional regulator [Gammaproteobacteria bacterium]|nr:Com family DNA-binding transcriptional regulator [Gammaproteobacteria bacterium]
MQNIRCQQCNKLLAKADFKQLEIKCPRCKFFNNLECHEHRRNTNGGTYGTNKTGKKF